jgi:hypothetical protein
MVTFNNVLELASQLSEEQQEMLTDILKKRLHESRRKHIAQECHAALSEFAAGGLKQMTAQEAIAELEIYLDLPV